MLLCTIFCTLEGALGAAALRRRLLPLMMRPASVGWTLLVQALTFPLLFHPVNQAPLHPRRPPRPSDTHRNPAGVSPGGSEDHGGHRRLAQTFQIPQRELEPLHPPVAALSRGWRITILCAALQGHFVRSLGKAGDKDTEQEVLLLEHDVPHQPFSQAVLSFLPQMPWTISPEVTAAWSEGSHACLPVCDSLLAWTQGRGQAGGPEAADGVQRGPSWMHRHRRRPALQRA